MIDMKYIDCLEKTIRKYDGIIKTIEDDGILDDEIYFVISTSKHCAFCEVYYGVCNTCPVIRLCRSNAYYCLKREIMLHERNAAIAQLRAMRGRLIDRLITARGGLR